MKWLELLLLIVFALAASVIVAWVTVLIWRALGHS